ncbi:hypothetical protein BLNAU_1266 [Blattamonas nauphoetae]|uniref:SCP domain-containing protein n=1 Tax=Blattamonas nauphoetae TaxID=2049346 RepID=A0ABQ9YIW0_9EUKA|nr:hypothetical protein BLNAU_1266 [Blattamonas nauphoetae]
MIFTTVFHLLFVFTEISSFSDTPPQSNVYIAPHTVPVSSSINNSYRYSSSKQLEKNLTMQKNGGYHDVPLVYDVLKLQHQSDYDYSVALGRLAVAITNKHRANKGLSPLLNWHPLIHYECDKHNKYMATTQGIDHEGFNERYAVFRANGGGGSCSENVLARWVGNTTAYEGMDQWFNSDGHRRNIEDATGNSAGVAFHHATGARYGVYGCQMFTNFTPAYTEDIYTNHENYNWVSGQIVPQITAIEIDANLGGSTATVTAFGRGFPTGITFTATVKTQSGSEKSFTINFDNDTQGSNTKVPIINGGLEAGETYEMVSVFNEDSKRVVFCQNITLMLPGGPPKVPKVLSLITEMNADKSQALIRIKGENLPNTNPFTIRYNSGVVRSITLSPSTSTESKPATIPLYPSPLAEYGETYAAWVSHTDFALDGCNQSFTIPQGPPRVISASGHLSADNRSIVVNVTGKSFPTTGQFSLRLETKKGVLTVNASPRSSTSATSDPISVGEDGELEYGEQCVVQSFTHSTQILCVGVVLTVPTLKPTIQSVEATIASDLDFMLVTLHGTTLPKEGNYTVKLNGSVKFTVTSIDEFSASGLVQMHPKVKMEYETMYVVKSIKHKTEKIIFNKMNFTTPAGGERVTQLELVLSSTREFIIVRVNGTSLPQISLLLTFQTTSLSNSHSVLSSSLTTPSLPNADIEVEVEIDENGGGETKFAVNETVPFVDGSNYKIVSIREAATKRELAFVPATLPFPTKPEKPGKKGGMSTGAVVGIVVGVIVGTLLIVALIVIVILLVVRKGKKRSSAPAKRTTNLQEIGTPVEQKQAVAEPYSYKPASIVTAQNPTFSSSPSKPVQQYQPANAYQPPTQMKPPSQPPPLPSNRPPPPKHAPPPGPPPNVIRTQPASLPSSNQNSTPNGQSGLKPSQIAKQQSAQPKAVSGVGGGQAGASKSVESHCYFDSFMIWLASETITSMSVPTYRKAFIEFKSSPKVVVGPAA